MAMSKTEIPMSTGATDALVEGKSVLVAIPTLNEEKHIEACIRSLMRGDDRLRAAKLVVADGGSTDATREIVTRLQREFPNVELIENPGRLQSAAVNLVAREQRLDDHLYLVRCDAHATYPPAYIMTVVDRLAAKASASLVVCMDSVGDSTCFQAANAWVVDTPLGSGGSAHRGGSMSGYVDHGHHAGFALDRFLSIGGYDESFSHNEDAELDERLAAAGGKIWLEADIRLLYRPRDRIGSLAKQYYSYGRGRARTLLKHRRRPKLRQLAPVGLFLGSAGGIAFSAITPWTFLAPVSYLALLIGTSLWGLFATRSACGLLSGLAAGTMHMSWAAGFLRQVFIR